MTHPALIERITRSLAYMLRHQPEKFGLQLDSHGFGAVPDVVRALNERLGEPVDERDLEEAIASGDRPRYEIAEGRVRALYGHSIEVEPGEPSQPPEFLFVGIDARDADRASRFGLRGGRRRFLHLALNVDDAREAGRRAGRDYSVLRIFALDAWEEGINFYDRKALYLAEHVPTQFLEVLETNHDGYEPQHEGGGPGESRGGFHGRRDHGRGGHGPRDHGRRDQGRRERGGGRFDDAPQRHGGAPDAPRHEAVGERFHGEHGRERPRHDERAPAPIAAAPAEERSSERGGFQRQHERAPDRPQERAHERPAERSGEQRRDRGDRHGRRDDRRGGRRDERPPREGGFSAPQRAPQSAPRAPEPRPSEQRAGDSRETTDFGVGVFEAPKRAESPPPPRRAPEPAAPPPPPRPVKTHDDAGDFGAGI